MIHPKLRKGFPVVPRVKYLLRAPIVTQDTDYTCGVAALQSVLYFWDEDEEYFEPKLAKRLKANTKDGVVSAQIESFARNHDFKVDIKEGIELEELKKYIREGKPVIVLLQAWRSSPRIKWSRWKDGHFAVVIGYDSRNIYFMDTSTVGNYTYIPTKEFIDRWHDEDGGKKVKNFGIILWKGKRYFDDRIAVKMK